MWVLAKVSIRSRGVGVNRARKKWLPDSHFRDWVDYKDGFGDFKLWNDEFWLGNDHIHSVLSEGQKRLTTPPLNKWYFIFLIVFLLFLMFCEYVFALKARTW